MVGDVRAGIWAECVVDGDEDERVPVAAVLGNDVLGAVGRVDAHAGWFTLTGNEFSTPEQLVQAIAKVCHTLHYSLVIPPGDALC